MPRLLIAAYISPAIPLLLAAFIQGLWGLLALYPLLLVWVIAFGVPILRQFFKRGLFKLHHSILAGVFSSIPMYSVFILIQFVLPEQLRVTKSFSLATQQLGFCMLIGAIVSSLYWLLGIWRNSALTINSRGTR